MRYRDLIVAATAITALSACDTTRPLGSEDVSLGEAFKYNAAVQTINPAPVYAAEGAQPGSSGAKGAAAVKRYRTDTVKAVETMETTQSIGDSGSGSGPR